MVRFFPLLVMLLGTTSMPIYADDLGFDRLEHLNTKNGLSHDWILDVQQDRQGFLWLATGDGLDRYDGYNFKVYRNASDDPRSISNSFVVCTYEDPSGALWVGTVEGLNRLDRFTDQFDRFLHDPDRPESLSHDYVLDIHEDRQGVLWIATLKGLNRFSPETESFTRFLDIPKDPDNSSESHVFRIHESRSGELWIGGQGGLHFFDRERGDLTHFPLNTSENEVGFWSIAEDEEGRFWVGSSQGDLIRFDPRSGEQVLHPLSASGIHTIEDLLWRPDGTLWVATEANGVLIFDPETGSWSARRHDPDESGSLSKNRVMSLFEDRTGVLWFGTDAGLDKLDPSRTRFSHYRHRSKDPNSLSADWISLVMEDRRGDLWIGSGGHGLNRLDHQTGDNTRHRHDPEDPTSLSDDSAIALLEDSDGMLWVGTHKGIDRLDPNTGRFSHLGSDLEITGELQSGWIFALAESEPGILWIGGSGGVDRLNTRTMEARHYELGPGSISRGRSLVYDLLIDRQGDLWVAMENSGLFQLERSDHGELPGPGGPGTLKFRHHEHDAGDPASLSDNEINTLFEDSSGTLWIGTRGGGLNRMNRADSGGSAEDSKKTFTHFQERQGLAHNNVLAILEDNSGYLWLSSNHGLTRLDPQTGDCQSYGFKDGLQGTAFLLGAAGKRASGELLFGGRAGLNGFFPDQLKNDPHAPQVAITEFRLFNRSLPLDARASRPLSWPSNRSEPRLVLSHRDPIFGFEVAALHFAKPEKNRYAYRLEGFKNGDWIETDARNRVAQYTNLDSGDYVFRVKAANADGLWNETGTSIRITIQPPPWKTWWAYSLYALISAAAIAAYIRSHRKELQRERAVSHRLREVDRLKDEFLANTSHELRTPLYGLTGLAESLLDGAAGPVSEAMRGNLSMIVTSGRRLGHMVNDLLDFSKLRHRSLEIDCRAVEIHALVDVVLTLSGSLVGAKGLRLENAVPRGLPSAYADENRLQQILFNLIGNAVKFTEKGSVEVSATAEDERLVIRVRDTGIGIPAEKKEHIFNAFEQGDASIEREYGGTGLGLSVTRQLVELHGGSIWVESSPGEGSSFFFSLPRAEGSMETPKPRPIADSALGFLESATLDPIEGPVHSAVPAPELTHPNTVRILAVDDEPINLQVLRNYLSLEPIELMTAPNGDEALRMIREQSFDLVLLDVMMPKISGFEVCRILRKTYKMENLPVLFLTAKNQGSDVVTGLSFGANDYLSKPIAKDELLARIRPHLDLLEIHHHLEDLIDEKMSQIKVLEGILPICCQCKSIRDEKDEWTPIEVYIDSRSEAQFSHGLCPDCVKGMFEQLGVDATA